ncbi:MAG TPA: thiamine pyrophosphate-dependent enzyme [Acidobacteriota bacterium]|jgi:2-oxoglutarate ferredoxin oxidoreductase subunit beta|nr:thiamine pyrophosphate-dependent enzyme [Acidobacteriota bacterium]HRV06964.1 thiamine pyrophosphate-dependent enzyme [Acidobacteriota bacterium]
MYGIKADWVIERKPRVCVLEDYIGAEPRWCPGCGDHAVLTAVQRVARDLQLLPEKTVVVSGIGCSSRFPHYMKTYGFHGLHGRALPVAEGIRSRRPDLNLFVITGDGDCCAIGTSHWIHAVRYNMDLTILLLDNNIYGLTKGQTSPTTRKAERSYTHPKGSFFVPINPISVTLGVPNASFVAQTIDWNPSHLYETIRRAHEHKGTSFVRVFQRCPHYSSHVFADAQNDPSRILLMTHMKGVAVPDNVTRMFPNRMEHDPQDLDEARRIASREDVFAIGLFYWNPSAERYDKITQEGLGTPPRKKLEAIERALDHFAV